VHGWVHVLHIRPVRVSDLESALDGTYYGCMGIAGGGSCYVIVRRGEELSPPPGWVSEAKRLTRHVPVWRRKVRGWDWVDISDEDLDHIETSLWPNGTAHTTKDSPYSTATLASVHYYHCPSGRTYTVHTPMVHGDGISWLHCWCLTSEWVAPPEEPQPSYGGSCWPAATAEPVIQIAMVKKT
jgi:hypothetical protein